MTNDNDVVITGIGLLSSLGEGADAHWDGLNAGQPRIDADGFAPFTVHPLAPTDFDRMIPKRSDQRQMEPWQRIGTYAAGLALDDAGIRGEADILRNVDMLVAAGGGERDTAVDAAILTDLRSAEDPGRLLNERLMSDLRPTLSLAQLSNLLAGNISIVHGVTGSSRTFMGEEMAGVDALRVAAARIEAGQSEIALVGSAYNGERKDILLQFAFGSRLMRGPHCPIWERTGDNAGLALASMGAFLVLESRRHAQTRGTKIYACLHEIIAEGGSATGGAFKLIIDGFVARCRLLADSGAAIISGAIGTQPETTEERDALRASLPASPVRATGTMLGHGVEAQFLINVALAALSVCRGSLWADPNEAQPIGKVAQVLVTARGQRRGVGLALVQADREAD
jgi:3-oxoacyl-[acyl-carrier-protein] synthase II